MCDECDNYWRWYLPEHDLYLCESYQVLYQDLDYYDLLVKEDDNDS